jgi:hypothetical protein
MLALLAALTTVAVAVNVLLVASILRRSGKSRFRQAVRHRIVCHTVDGYSLEGVLSGLYADGLVVGTATFVRVGEPDTPLDGEQLIPWRSVSWIQELGESAEPGRAEHGTGAEDTLRAVSS